ncbi:hypothetical protein QJS66_18015 [Kocuria rhizophila]|nr:hypothetical protein QJS66_18015 [Kocuria rhizophila]
MGMFIAKISRGRSTAQS